MSVTPITNSVQGALTKGAGWYVEGDVAFTRTLTIGQILKARILRHYEGGRYLAEINGQQKVVDSAIPLRIGEVVHGRVTELDKRVHLQRTTGEPDRQHQAISLQRPLSTGNGRWLEAFLARYETHLSAVELGLLLRQTARVSQPHLMVLGALVLEKSGTVISAEFLNALYRVLNTDRLRDRVEHLDSPYQLSSANAPSKTGTEDTVQQLAGLLASNRCDAWRRYVDVFDEKAIDQEESGQAGAAEQGPKQKWDTPYKEWLLGQRLLNTQGEGSVSHRLSHIPLWIGDRLVEISVALFSQKESTCSEDAIRHRRLVLSLETTNLGHLQITVNLADRHLRLHLLTQAEEVTERLACHFGKLKSVLESYEWVIDEIKYVTDSSVENGAAVRAVVEHHIARDSLSRLM
jgi:hypothetical protein